MAFTAAVAFQGGHGLRRRLRSSTFLAMAASAGVCLALLQLARLGSEAFAGGVPQPRPLGRAGRGAALQRAALGVGAPESALLLAAAEASGGDFPMGLAAAGGVLVLAAAAAAAFFGGAGGQARADGTKEEELPPWADMFKVLQDALSGRPFDVVLLNMRARHGDAFRIYIPNLFGETIVLMGREANQFVFTEQDKYLDQALGGVVGTAVSGKKTMGTKERKTTEAGKIFDKASANFFANKGALKRATEIFVTSAGVFCDRMDREVTADMNVFETLWRYVVQTNADMLYGEGQNAGSIVCNTIDSINKKGLFAPEVRQAGEELRLVLDNRYKDRIVNPSNYEGEDTLFEEFFRLSEGRADEEMLAGFQQFMLTLQLAANGNQLVTIRWLMSHVYADPDLLRAIRAEVQAKLDAKGKDATIQSLELDDLLDLTLTNACITEAVRLHSDIPSKLTLRQAEIEMAFGGFKIPKGATIFLYADAVHKDETYFPNNASFCPHRYTDKETFNKMQMDREITTFGHGRKRCTGELHARSQISALLAAFVMRFDMDLRTNEPDNRIPEDHDGPFVFDTANSVCLVNMRQRIEDVVAVSPTAQAMATAAYLGRLEEASASAPAADETSSASKGTCPFSSLFGGATKSE